MRILPGLLLFTACVETEAPSEPDSFTVAFIPDSQIYARDFPETFDRHTRWLVDHATEHDIVFVSHVGDIVHNDDEPTEWDVAEAAYERLRRAGIPHGLAIGNHDVVRRDDCPGSDDNLPCRYAEFTLRFGPQVYGDEPWYLGSSPSGGSNAQRIRAGGLDLLFLHLPMDTPREEVDWAKGILDAHPDALAHVTTHRFLFDYRLTRALPSPLDLFPAGRFNAFMYTFLGQDSSFETSLTADALFDELIAPYPNIWTIVCGHVDAEYTQLGTNLAGLPVHETLIDFQNHPEGGEGWLRLLRYIPSENRIEASTVSTETGEVRANGQGFEMSVQILRDYADRGLAEIEQLGFSTDGLIETLEEIEDEGSELRQLYYDSLYDPGQRNSSFDIQLDFEAYMTARD